MVWKSFRAITLTHLGICLYVYFNWGSKFDNAPNVSFCFVFLIIHIKGLLVMSCYVMLCYVMLCYVMLCYVMLCYVMLYYVMLCYVINKNI